MKYLDFVRESALKKEDIDRFLDARTPNWAKFDPELGYTLGNYLPKDGIDDALTISTARADGSRTSAIYSDRPRRLNTYGNSFTQCHQVSDHETWQEYLAAHLGEPIGNFGVGGYGVYQSYRRLIRTEASDLGAPHVLLYLWGDDHYRSLLRCRHVLIHRWWRFPSMFHGNFWANIEIEPKSGKFIEKPNVLRSPASLYQMADADFLANALADDLMLQMMTFMTGAVDDVDVAKVNRLAEILGVTAITGKDRTAMLPQVTKIADAYAFAATKHIIDLTQAFAANRGKKLLICLFCPRVTQELVEKGTRYDQSVVDHLRARKLRYFDMNLVHVEDFKQFNIPYDQYMKRYTIGHYSPAGNHFFAFAIKNAIVDLMEPKPMTYRSDSQARIDFSGYLPA